MPTVRLDGMLSQYLRRRSVSVDAQNIDSMLDALEGEYPRLRHRLRDETRKIRPFVRVYVNGEEISSLQGAATPLAAGDSVEILHSIQGG